jgi:hypothetical protein
MKGSVRGERHRTKHRLIYRQEKFGFPVAGREGVPVGEVQRFPARPDMISYQPGGRCYFIKPFQFGLIRMTIITGSMQDACYIRRRLDVSCNMRMRNTWPDKLYQDQASGNNQGDIYKPFSEEIRYRHCWADLLFVLAKLPVGNTNSKEKLLYGENKWLNVAK